MTEQITKNGEGYSSPGVAALEERVQRLEDVMASLQDTRQLENRVVESVMARMANGRGNDLRRTTGLIIEAGRQLLPAPTEILRQRPEGTPVQVGNEVVPGRPPWILYEVYAQGRSTIRMYLDPRYRLSWQGRILVPVLLVLIFLSSFLFPLSGIPLIGPLVVQAGDLILAFVLFIILHREATYYRRVSPDLPPSLRL
jgi:hypothetical protein